MTYGHTNTEFKVSFFFTYFVIQAQKCVHECRISVHLFAISNVPLYLLSTISTELQLNNTYGILHVSQYSNATK